MITIDLNDSALAGTSTKAFIRRRCRARVLRCPVRPTSPFHSQDYAGALSFWHSIRPTGARSVATDGPVQRDSAGVRAS